MSEKAKKPNNQCIMCDQVLTKEGAEQHYKDRHLAAYMMAYRKEEVIASFTDPEFVKIASSLSKCGRCKEDNACEHCSPFFEARRAK